MAVVSVDRQFPVYGGQCQIGTVIERRDKTCIAKGADGRKLGTFANLEKAVAEISDVDRVFVIAERGEYA